MGFLAAAGLILDAGSSIGQFVSSRQNMKEAERALAEFQRQRLTNAAAGLTPSTEAERIAQAQASKMLAAVTDVGGSLNASEAMGLVGTGLSSYQDYGQKIFSSILDKEYQADLERVRDEQQIRQLQEARDNEMISSLREQAIAGQQGMFDAVGGFAQTAIATEMQKKMIQAMSGENPYKNSSAFSDLIKKMFPSLFGEGTKKGSDSSTETASGSENSTD